MIDANLFSEHEARYQAGIMVDTWGHLDARPNELFEGTFIFHINQYGQCGVIKSDFGENEPTGYMFFNDVHEYVWKMVDKYSVGVYSFTGTYKVYSKYSPKNTGYGFFRGKIKQIC